MTNADNVRQFSLDLSKWADLVLPEAVVQTHRRATMDLLRRLINKSPVGNPSKWKLNFYGLRKKSKRRAPKGYVGGTFRGFWQVYIGNDPGTGEQPPAKGTQPRPPQQVVTSAQTALENLVPFSVTYIVNGMPYAGRLNEGWSSQAPAGFVELAVAETDRQVYSSLSERFDAMTAGGPIL